MTQMSRHRSEFESILIAGDTSVQYGLCDDALDCFENGLVNTRIAIAESGETPELLREEVTLLIRIAKVHFENERFERALKLFKQALTQCRCLQEVEIDETLQTLQDLAACLYNVGVVLNFQEKLPVALGIFEKELVIRKHIVGEYGETLESLQEVSGTLELLGDIHSALRQRGKTTIYYEECLEVNRLILSNYERTTDSLTNVANILRALGIEYNRRARRTQALNCFEESVAILRQILAEYGHDSESLRELYWSLSHSGHVHAKIAQYARNVDENYLKSRSHCTSALKCFGEIQDIERRLLMESGESTDSLTRQSWVLTEIGDVYWIQRDHEGALKYYEEGLLIDRCNLVKYGETEDVLYSLQHLLGRIGDSYNESGQIGIVIERYKEGISVNRQMISKKYGDSTYATSRLSILLEVCASNLILNGLWNDAMSAIEEDLELRKGTPVEKKYSMEISHIKWLRGDGDAIQYYRSSIAESGVDSVEFIEKINKFVERKFTTKTRAEELFSTLGIEQNESK